MKMDITLEAEDQVVPEEARLRRVAALVEAQLLSMWAQLDELRLRILDGDVTAFKDSAKITADIRQWLRIAMETEAKLNETRKQSGGGTKAGHAIDFDQARSQIGCRLDRLRRCGDPERVS